MNNLKFYRKKVGLTQKELAEKVGVGQSAIGNYESDIREPSVGMALIIYNILKNRDETIEFTTLWNKKLGK